MKNGFFIFALMMSLPVFAETVCIKDGKEISVYGSTEDSKREACKSKGGSLQERAAQEARPASGSGGGW